MVDSWDGSSLVHGMFLGGTAAGCVVATGETERAGNTGPAGKAA